MRTITIGSENVTGCFLALFKAKPWLKDPEVMAPNDAPAEAEAIGFLLRLARHDVSNWGSTSPAGRRVATSLLLDFMAKLMHPESPLHHFSWQVPAGEPEWKQALHVLAYEIQKSHGQQPVQH